MTAAAHGIVVLSVDGRAVAYVDGAAAFQGHSVQPGHLARLSGGRPFTLRCAVHDGDALARHVAAAGSFPDSLATALAIMDPRADALGTPGEEAVT